ncbi:MAG TPA: MerR family transcriptional regulator [Methylomusa anaerophila]|uniref:HTH-type transcriptional regulator AdhR n=1 Tax=Methylomusa anaerophila TaxID=1930071 RepID=A0A348AGL8_9FIRM|nr:MerR family transcriptional regulator [Methylomusa anaerophila]BBB90216.1 HTH-type transcriptional regulator AdhR [Methylomusa anaerophila]HML90730.1 MerR family transcriptional regulator [Methylomusa anaerophila]
MTVSIKQFAQESGVSEHTLRFYEKEGILPFVKRNEHGNRIYDEQNFEWIYFITSLRETGMPLSEIKRYAELFKQGDSTIPERKRMMLDHKKKAEEQLAQILKHMERINYKLALYDVMEKTAKFP